MRLPRIFTWESFLPRCSKQPSGGHTPDVSRMEYPPFPALRVGLEGIQGELAPTPISCCQYRPLTTNSPASPAPTWLPSSSSNSISLSSAGYPTGTVLVLIWLSWSMKELRGRFDSVEDSPWVKLPHRGQALEDGVKWTRSGEGPGESHE